MSNNIPVDIDFVLKNVNFEAETQKIKDGIQGVGEMSEKVTSAVENNFADTFRAAGKEADLLNTKLSKSGAGAATFTRNMNGLSFSMQQVARELPSLAISPQMFMLAISNNLPILQDQIKRTRIENEALKLSGQSTVPVWKQMVSSLFSWQTALVAGITILTVYGKEIFNRIGGLFKAKDAVKLTREEIKGLTAELAKNMGQELGTANMLFDALEKTRKGSADYYDVRRKIIDQYGNYLDGLDSEITSLRNVEGAYRAITAAIIDQAREKSLAAVREKETQDATKTTIEQYQIIRSMFSEKFGAEIGGFKFEQFRKEFESGKGLSYEIKRIIADFNQEVAIAGNTSITGATVGGYMTTINKVQEAVNKVGEANKNAAAKIADAENLIGKIFSGPLPTIDLPFNDQVIALKKNLAEAKKELESLIAANAQTSKVKFQQVVVDNLEKQLTDLTGKAKETKAVADELKKAEDALEKAVIKGGQKEIDYLAAKVALLQKELELRKWTAEEAVAFANGKVTQAQRDSILNPTGITGKTPDKNYVGATKTVQGVVYEITAIDKTGPVWSKVKLEGKKLAKFQKDNAKDVAEYQEKLDREALEKKETFERDLLGYSRQFTGELINQLGLTQEQNAELQGIADTLFNLASGNWLAAGFSAASTLMTLLFSKDNKKDPSTEALENVNNLLKQQSAILANLAGTNYFELAAKQYDDYGTAIDKNNQKLQQSNLLTKKEYENAKAYYDQQVRDFPNGPIANAGWSKFISQRKGESANWSPQQFIDAYTSGSAALNNQQIEWVKGIVEAQKQRAELLQETFRQSLGFDSTNVSDSIMTGIQEGLKLSENGLGGFAKSFGEQIKTALVKNITDALNIRLTEGFLTDFNEFMKNGSLSAEERAALEREYELAVAEGNARYEAIKPILDKYGVTTDAGQKGLSGIQSSLTEETGSVIAGIGTAIRIDIKEILKRMAAGDDDMVNQLLYMKQISENTGATVTRLAKVEEGIAKTNKLLEERL